MSLDRATIERIAARQGAPLDPENIARIQAFAAANPDVLERYSMGTAVPPQLQSGRDIRGGAGPQDNSALLNLDRSINTSIDQTNGAAAPLPAPQMQAAMPRSTPAPAPRAPIKDAVGMSVPGQDYPQNTATPPQQQFIPLSPDSPYISATSSDPLIANPPSAGIIGSILGALGLGGAVAGAEYATRGRDAMPKPAEPYGPNEQAGPPKPRSPQQQVQSPDDVQRLRESVDADNAAAAAKAEQDAAKLKKQMTVQEYIRRAQRSVGRR